MDAEIMKDVQSVLSKQFKHIVVLLVEVVNCQTPKLQESRQTFDKRLENLLTQTQALSRWVLKFDP